MVDVPTAHLWVRRFVIVTAGVIVLMLVDWVMCDPQGNLHTDWTAFDLAADRLLSGEEVYRPYSAESEPLPYLYPPFVLPLALPLAGFGFYGSYAISALGTFVAFVGGMLVFARIEQRSADKTTGLIAAIVSGAVISATLIGQYSGLYVAFFGVGGLLLARGRQALAGVVLALLWMKPNIAVVVPVALLWSRQWRCFAGFAGCTAALVGTSVVLVPDQWRGFLSNAQMMAELQQQDVVPFEKMVSVLGGAHAIFGFSSGSPVAASLFMVVALVLGIAVLQLWTPAALRESPIRAFGALALFAVAANPRIYFYDATLVAMGMFGLWVSAQTVGGPLAKRWVRIVALLTWLSLWGGTFVELNRVVGAIAACGLVISSCDAWMSSRGLQPVAVLPPTDVSDRTVLAERAA